MTVTEQAQVFLVMALLGAALGVIYDVLFLLRCALRAGGILTALLDLLFGVICAAGMTAASAMLRVQAVRWFVFAGTALGLALYAASAGRLLRWGIGAVCAFGRRHRPKEDKNSQQV